MKNLELEHIFIPAKIPSKKLMIILHGRGDSSDGFKMLPEFLDLDNMNYLMFDAPFEYFTGHSWYQLPPNQLPGIEYSSKLLSKDLDTLFEIEFNPEESFLFGFSQGSLLSFEFGARYHKKLAGYIGISGYIYDPLKLLQEMNKELLSASWLCTHGTNDTVLPLTNTQEQIEILQKNNWNIEFKVYNKDHSITKDELEYIAQWIREQLPSTS